MLTRKIITVAVASLLSVTAMISFEPKAESSPDIEVAGVYQHTITIETDARDKCFAHPDFTKLRPVTKASITVDPTDNSEKQYEEIWYANAVPISLQRKEPYSKKVQPGKLVAIRIKHKQPQNGTRTVKQEEATSAADAILRVYLDVRLHHGSVAAVILPADTFDLIITGLEKNHYAKVTDEDVENEVSGIARLTIISDEQGGQTATMRWDG